MEKKSKKENILRYFDLKASDYISKSNNILWGGVKKRESNAVLKLLDPCRGDHILDVGCGDGFLLSKMGKLGCEAEGIDLSPKMVAEAQEKGLVAWVADIDKGIAGGKFYDKVVCCGVFEFCDDDQKALMNLKSVLNDNGAIILLLPKKTFSGFSYKIFHKYFGCREDINLFSNDQLHALSQACGMRICEILIPTPFAIVVKMSKAN